MRKFEIWGSYPPPIGGVSIHVMRLIHAINKKHRVILKDFQGHEDTGFEYIKPVRHPLWEILRLLTFKKKVIHVNTSSTFSIVLALLPFLSHHYIGTTIHGLAFWKKTGWRRRVLSYYMRHMRFIFMNSHETKKEFCEYLNVDMGKVHILPAFLPPSTVERRGIKEEAMEFRKRHDFLLSANAFRLKFDHNGNDLYGLDMLVRLVLDIRKARINAGLLFCLPIIGEDDYYAQVKQEIEKLGIQNHVLFVMELSSNDFEYWELSDLFIRPTTTDMEGLSVKEALYVGTPAIASDVCNRPAKCVLFESRNYDDLRNKTMELYGEIKARNMKVSYQPEVKVEDYIWEVYCKVAGNAPQTVRELGYWKFKVIFPQECCSLEERRVAA